MAVCKKCGCAIPIGSKSCDMCATMESIAPAQQPQAWTPPAWTPPAQSAAPIELASSAASWAAVPGAVRPTGAAELLKARKALRRAFWIFAIVGGISVALGLVVEVANITALKGLANWFAVGEGAIFLILAYFTRRGSMVATIIGTALYILDTVALMFAGRFSIVRVVIIVALIQAVLSANLLRQQPKQGTVTQDAISLPDQSRAA